MRVKLQTFITDKKVQRSWGGNIETRWPRLETRASSTSQGQNPSHRMCQSDIAVKVSSPASSISRFLESLVGLSLHPSLRPAWPERPSVGRALWIGLVERVCCDPSIIMIHYKTKGKMDLHYQDSRHYNKFFFKAITVERTNNLDIHKDTQRQGYTI